MNCPHCRSENPKVARFCLHCGMALILHCPGCETELPANAQFCMNCGQPVSSVAPADEAPPLAITPEPGLTIGERRITTALFMDVVGSTALAEQMDPEDWTAIMNGAFDRFYPVVHRYEGTIAHLMGDALLAFFGAPVAHEDDPVRAVRAALDLLAAADKYAADVERDYGVRFEVRIGLNTSPVIVGQLGSDLRYEYTAMGAAVDVAARMQSAARPMTALIAEDTYRFVAPLFDFEDLGFIRVKGQNEPVHAYQVLGSKAEPGQVRGLARAGLESPMVGRDDEMTALTQLCEAVRAGLGRAVLVVGEPGLGKSRLVAEWRVAVQEHLSAPPAALWLEGHCLSYGQGMPYHLLLDLLRSLIGVPEAAGKLETQAALLAFVEEELLESEALDIYPFLAHLLMLDLEGEALERVKPLDPQALQTQYLSALRRLLQAIAARRPLVLILEDIHWADPSSTELLVRLLPLASNWPVLFCMVTRPNRDAPGWRLISAAREVLGGSLTEITLHALSESDSWQLVANLLEIEALPEQTSRLILKKAEGNPFFVEEVIRMLIDRGAIVQKNGGWAADETIQGIEIPDNLQGLLLERIDRLPDDVKHTLRVAAVLGRQFPVRALEQTLEGEMTG